jgi:type II secretory pathway pseudopilin PulG
MRFRNPQQSSRQRGTTILELLVVVTVILIVMSLVLVTLVKVYHAVTALGK